MDPFDSLWKCVVLVRAKALQSVCTRPAGSGPLEGCFEHAWRFHVCSCSPCQGSAQSAKPRVGFSVRDPDVNLIDDFQLTSCHSSGASEGIHHEHRAGA